MRNEPMRALCLRCALPMSGTVRMSRDRQIGSSSPAVLTAWHSDERTSIEWLSQSAICQMRRLREFANAPWLRQSESAHKPGIADGIQTTGITRTAASRCREYCQRETLYTALRELRQLAERQLRRNSSAPISPTTLLHEAYLGIPAAMPSFRTASDSWAMPRESCAA
jgi:hypothetical protein